MSDMKLQKTSVTAAEDGAWRVELTIADTDDTATARESILVQVVVGPFPRSLLLEEIQEAALLRIQEVVAQRIAQVKKSVAK